MQQHKTPTSASKRKTFLVTAGVFVFMLTLGYLIGGGLAKTYRHLQTTEQSSTTR